MTPQRIADIRILAPPTYERNYMRHSRYAVEMAQARDELLAEVERLQTKADRAYQQGQRDAGKDWDHGYQKGLGDGPGFDAANILRHLKESCEVRSVGTRERDHRDYTVNYATCSICRARAWKVYPFTASHKHTDDCPITVLSLLNKGDRSGE